MNKEYFNLNIKLLGDFWQKSLIERRKRYISQVWGGLSNAEELSNLDFCDLGEHFFNCIVIWSTIQKDHDSIIGGNKL